MAKKTAQKPVDTPKERADESQNSKGGALPPDSAVTTDTAPNNEAKTADGAEKPDNAKSTQPRGEGVIDPVAFEIKLKAHHPLESYGRCGYRFNKTEAVQISKMDLTGEQIIELANDPWLEFVPVCEE